MLSQVPFDGHLDNANRNRPSSLPSSYPQLPTETMSPERPVPPPAARRLIPPHPPVGTNPTIDSAPPPAMNDTRPTPPRLRAAISEESALKKSARLENFL